MTNIGKYIWIFIAVVVLQAFIFDSLTITSLIVIHVYPIFILSLPINTTQSRMLMLSTLLGVTLDVVCAGGGLYTITTVASSMLRAPLIKFLLRHREVIDGATPSVQSLELSGYLLLILIYLGVQMALFLTIEGLGVGNINFLVFRYFSSLVCTFVINLLILRVLNSRSKS